MRRWILVASGLAAGCGGHPSAPTGASASRGSTADDPLIGVGTVELVDSGHVFLEGPQWRETEQDLVFSDLEANTIFRYLPGGPAPTVMRTPSHDSNGLAVDGRGALLAAEHGSRSVTRTIGTTTTTIASTFEGKRLNSPNDVVVADDGTIYFTDPPMGIDEAELELDFIGVYRVADDKLTAEHRGALTEGPNGIGLAPDGTHLYVTDTSASRLYRYALTGGALGPREELAKTGAIPDGLAVDAQGNIFVTSVEGVEVFAPDGSKWGAIALPEQPANCAFGDVDHRTLYITARTGLYRVRLAGAGEPTR